MTRQSKGTLPAADRGLYVIWMRLAGDVRVQVGALGEIAFRNGLYAYVGSAQRNREARIRRHLARDKATRWHIDYLRPHVDVVAVTSCEGTKADECRLVDRVIELFGASRACRGFGSSDCRCGGHLLIVPERALESIDGRYSSLESGMALDR